VTPAALFVCTLGTVFFAEVVGDKTLHTLGSLAARYRTVPLALGAGVAFMFKMAAAVALADAVHHLPARALQLASAATFLSLALVLWRKAPEEPPTTMPPAAGLVSASAAFAVAFAAVFFSEWGDPGQVATATLAARHGDGLVVWAAATLAMFAKGAVGLFAGAALRRRVRRPTLRWISIGACVLMGAVSLLAPDR